MKRDGGWEREKGEKNMIFKERKCKGKTSRTWGEEGGEDVEGGDILPV